MEPQASPEHPTPENTSLYDDEARKLIRRLANSVIGKYGFHRCDRDDLEQELALDLCRRSPQFDSARLDRKTFVTSVLRNRLRSLIRDNCRHKRRQPAHDDEALDSIPDGAHRHYVAPRANDELECLETRLDVETRLVQLPPEVRALAELLQTVKVAEAARQLGLSRRELQRQLKVLRTQLADLSAGVSKRKADKSSEKRSISTDGDCELSESVPITSEHPAMSLASDLSFLQREPAEAYHARAGEFLASHMLADFRKCPLLYHRKRAGLLADEDRPAYLVGRAAHTVILEGLDVFHQTYAVGGPVNPKTGQPFGSSTKAWAEWAEAQGKPVLTTENYNLVMRMAEGVRENAEAKGLLGEGVAEGVVRTEYCGVACQIRLDWLNPKSGIVDLKTADDLTWFEADARRYGYSHQLAFYRAVLAQVIGVWMPVHLIAVEKKEPHRCGVWRVSDDTLSIAQQENEAAIRRLRHCTSLGSWPTGYEDVRVFEAA